jgi:hypothetical protein
MRSSAYTRATNEILQVIQTDLGGRRGRALAQGWKLLRRAVRRRCNRGRRTERLPSREAVLHKFGIQRGSSEPVRVLHCSTDVGASAVRRKVPSECLGQKAFSAACKSAFEQAGVALVAALAPTVTDLH